MPKKWFSNNPKSPKKMFSRVDLFSGALFLKYTIIEGNFGSFLHENPKSALQRLKI
jgi:hypothetical protein